MQTNTSDAVAQAAVPARRIADLPGPFALPLLGNALQVRPSRIHQIVEGWSRVYGDYFRICFGRTKVLVVADHEAITAILRERPERFRRPSNLSAISDELNGLPGVFQAEGVEWKNQRRMVMQAFAPHAIKAYFPALVKVVLRLQRRWDQAARSGTPIALESDLKRYTVDVIAGLAFGTEVNTIESGDDVIQGHMDTVLAGVARRSIALFPYWRYFRLPADRRLERGVAALAAAVNELIAKARARMRDDPAPPERPRNMLEAMIAAADQSDSLLDDRAVAGNVSTMLLAGEDTTASTLAWSIYLLQRHPAVLERVRAEVLRVAPDPAGFTVEQMDGLDFLDACVQETMRLKPIAPFMPLEAVTATQVGDIAVPAGGLLWCVLRKNSVADRYFPDGASFDPARWLVDAGARAGIDKRVAMPFGAGPRMCPGRYLALLEIKVVLAMLIGQFDVAGVDARDGGEVREKMGFVMAPERLIMRLRSRMDEPGGAAM